MEWVNLVGFFLAVSTTIIGLGSFIATCRPYKSDAANEAKDYEDEEILIAA